MAGHQVPLKLNRRGGESRIILVIPPENSPLTTSHPPSSLAIQSNACLCACTEVPVSIRYSKSLSKEKEREKIKFLQLPLSHIPIFLKHMSR